VASLALAASMSARGDVLGEARLLSALGEPLRVTVPVHADSGPALAGPCLALRGGTAGDDVPHIVTARVAVERNGAAAHVAITTSEPVHEPVVRLVLQTTCAGDVRRYTLLLEPADGVPKASSSIVRRDVEIVLAAPRVAANAAVTPDEPPTEATGASRTDVVPVDALLRLQDENAALRRELAEVRSELEQRMVTAAAATRASSPASREPRDGITTAAGAPGWDAGWPVYAAMGGLLSIAAGGLLWRRRHAPHATEEWALTGPPSQRTMSRTSLAQQPVRFEPPGIAAEAAEDLRSLTLLRATGADGVIRRRHLRDGTGSAAALLLQPSAEELATPDASDAPLPATRAASLH
jgi:hypothetical protein